MCRCVQASINMSSTDIKANDIPGNDLVYVSKGTGRSTTSKPSAIGIRGVRPGMDFRVEVVGATVKNTPASKKPASKPNKTIVFHGGSLDGGKGFPSTKSYTL